MLHLGPRGHDVVVLVLASHTFHSLAACLHAPPHVCGVEAAGARVRGRQEVAPGIAKVPLRRPTATEVGVKLHAADTQDVGQPRREGVIPADALGRRPLCLDLHVELYSLQRGLAEACGEHVAVLTPRGCARLPHDRMAQLADGGRSSWPLKGLRRPRVQILLLPTSEKFKVCPAIKEKVASAQGEHARPLPSHKRRNEQGPIRVHKLASVAHVLDP
mmetsp:Transcript_24596/g.70740  ORF Transcript_24596/g.70740 Transcript_24596/m.70740 type:complete len:217 (-) Transcript_24596:245-895(-)